MMAISAKAVPNCHQFVSWLATFATFVQCFYPSCGWRHNLPLDGSGGKPIAIPAKLVVLYLAMVANGLVPMGGFVCDFEYGSASGSLHKGGGCRTPRADAWAGRTT